MILNPKLGKTPSDISNLTYKDAKAIIKKDLKRLEKNTSADNPVSVMVIGEQLYPDKPTGIGLLLIGTWKGDFKKMAKQEIVKESLGAIGQIYYGGVDAEGQKIIHIDLAKGKGKSKQDKLAKGLKKIIPQATYNIVFGEMAEKALENLESKLDQLPEVPENIDNATEDEGEVEIDNLDAQKLLDSNLTELSASLAIITKEVYPRLKAKKAKEGDADSVIDTLDLANEWLELFEESGDNIKTLAKNGLARTKVLNIKTQVEPMLPMVQQLIKIKTIKNKAIDVVESIEELIALFN